ncbi:hypothetical protein L7F22_033989 [Adiantum nelumboides]|nr:hypothetical protein [Adiantum nelumboides]
MAIEHYATQDKQRREKFNKGLKDKELKRGTLVLCYDNRFDTRKDKKFMSRWEGPYVIRKKYTNGSYRLQDISGKVHKTRVNGWRLKPYFQRFEVKVVVDLPPKIREQEEEVDKASFSRQALGCKMKSLARGLSSHKTVGKGTMSDSKLELQDQTPPINQLVTRSCPSKVEVKVKAVHGTPECVASNSKQSTKSLKALEYPRLSKFCFLIEELHEEYGLSLEGKLPKELSDKDIPDEEWLSVFKCLHKKNTKLFLNHVRDELIDECRLLYQKVYQATPSNGELLAKFARVFVYERCSVAASDPIGHRIAWERFGGSVLENSKMQKGGLERKINKFCIDHGLTGVIQIEASISDGALSSIPTMSASKLQPFYAVEMPMYIQLVLSMADRLSDQENEQKRLLGEGVGPAKQGAGGAQDLTQFKSTGGRPQRETNPDKSSHVPELDKNITELLELDKSNIELSDGFQHGKTVVKSGDRVEEPEAELFVVENRGKETIGQDSSKLSTDNQEGSLEIVDKVEDAEDVETLLIIADTLRKKCKR